MFRQLFLNLFGHEGQTPEASKMAEWLQAEQAKAKPEPKVEPTPKYFFKDGNKFPSYEEALVYAKKTNACFYEIEQAKPAPKRVVAKATTAKETPVGKYYFKDGATFDTFEAAVAHARAINKCFYRSK